ncbi:MAG: carotenoid 1,2-hydratase [Candidatus Riflebacteria bacterium]|nr:carotenoid 1,2-hydratase [Candidatus Riflebacteria bacterium]
MKKCVLISFVLIIISISMAGADTGPTIGRGYFGSPKPIQEFYDQELLKEIRNGEDNLLDRFLEGINCLDDTDFFKPTLKKVQEVIRWKALHREDFRKLASRLPQIENLLARFPKKTDPKTIEFPRDGGRHLDKLVEWWYWNGHLFDEEKREYSFEACFFRFGPLIHFAHFAVTDVTGKRFLFERTFFSPLSCVLSENRLELKYGDWEIVPVGQDFISIKAQAKDIAIQLLARSEKPPLLVNQNGYVKMGVDGYSYYYSQPRWQTTGALRFKERAVKVAGQSWFDHQWGNFFLSTVLGWDWFCFKLTDNIHYNIFSFHSLTGAQVNPVATIQYANGTQETTRIVKLEPINWWTSPHTRRKYPSGYVLTLPEKNSVFTVKPKVIDQELFADPFSPDFIDYWEGPCTIEGNVAGKPVQGQCFNEICGYPKVAP